MVKNKTIAECTIHGEGILSLIRHTVDNKKHYYTVYKNDREIEDGIYTNLFDATKRFKEEIHNHII